MYPSNLTEEFEQAYHEWKDEGKGEHVVRLIWETGAAPYTIDSLGAEHILPNTILVTPAIEGWRELYGDDPAIAPYADKLPADNFELNHQYNVTCGTLLFLHASDFPENRFCGFLEDTYLDTPANRLAAERGLQAYEASGYREEDVRYARELLKVPYLAKLADFVQDVHSFILPGAFDKESSEQVIRAMFAGTPMETHPWEEQKDLAERLDFMARTIEKCKDLRKANPSDRHNFLGIKDLQVMQEDCRVLAPWVKQDTQMVKDFPEEHHILSRYLARTNRDFQSMEPVQPAWFLRAQLEVSVSSFRKSMEKLGCPKTAINEVLLSVCQKTNEQAHERGI